MQHRSFRIVVLTLLPALLAGCSDTMPTHVQQPQASAPLFQISDAANASGRTGFYFVPPMVADPGPFTGTFDANLSPEVRVCQLVAATAPASGFSCGQTIKTFTLTPNSSGEAVVVNAADQSYSANWRTKNNPANLALGQDQYRVEVRVGTALLGSADLLFVNSSSDLKTVVGPYVGAVAGSPLNIAFRIETRTVGSVTITPPMATIALHNTQVFSAEVRDLHGNVVANTATEWASSNPAVATVNPASGGSTTATGSTAGASNITATNGGVTSSALLRVMRVPDAMDDSYSLTAGETLQSSGQVPRLLTNDDVGSPAGRIDTVFVAGTPYVLPLPIGGVAFAGGTLSVFEDGSFRILNPTRPGASTFDYTLTNAAGSDRATVTINVSGSGPVAKDDHFTINRACSDLFCSRTQASLLANVLSDNGGGSDSLGLPKARVVNFAFAGGTFSAGETIRGQFGSISISSDGTLTYSTDELFGFDPGFVGTLTLTYTIENVVDSSTAFVTITVENPRTR